MCIRDRCSRIRGCDSIRDGAVIDPVAGCAADRIIHHETEIATTDTRNRKRAGLRAEFVSVGDIRRDTDVDRGDLKWQCRQVVHRKDVRPAQEGDGTEVVTRREMCIRDRLDADLHQSPFCDRSHLYRRSCQRSRWTVEYQWHHTNGAWLRWRHADQ